MYIVQAHLCVFLCVCLTVHHRIPALLHGPGCNLGEWYGVPLVVHCLVDLQSIYRFRCYDNIQVCKLMALYTANAYSAKHEVSASACFYLLCAWFIV